MSDDDSGVGMVAVGGALAGCAAVKLIGATALLGGVSASIGSSTGATYLVAAGVAIVVAALGMLGLRTFRGARD